MTEALKKSVKVEDVKLNLERQMKLDTKVLAIAISSALLQGCSIFSTTPIEYKPVAVKSLFGKPDRNQYAELAHNSYARYSHGGMPTLSSEARMLLRDKDAKLEELQQQVQQLTRQVSLLLAATQKSNEQTKELVKTTLQTSKDISVFRFSSKPVDESPLKTSKPNKIERKVIPVGGNLAGGSGRMLKASDKIEVRPIPKPVNEIAKSEPASSGKTPAPVKTQVKREKPIQVIAQKRVMRAPEREAAVSVKANTKVKDALEANKSKPEIKKDRPTIKNINLNGFENVRKRDGSTRYYIKPSKKKEKKTALKGPIDVVVKFETKQLRDYYYKLLKMRGYRGMVTQYLHDSGGWIIHIGRYETFRRAHAAYKVVGRNADKGVVKMLYGKKSLSI